VTVKCIEVVKSNFDELCLCVHVNYSTTYSGDHGFEVSVQKQPKETKSATWTVSSVLMRYNS